MIILQRHNLINFPKIVDLRGNLTYIQSPHQIPFSIKRTYWTFDIPSGGEEQGRAFYNLNEIIIALSGSFDVNIINVDGKKEKITLNKPNIGLLIPSLNWRKIENFSTNSVCLHICDFEFDSKDYISSFSDFENLINDYNKNFRN